MKIEVKLAKSREPLQISYPKGFTGEKSGKTSDKEIHISTQPRYITQDEVGFIEAYIRKLPYEQGLEKTGVILVGNDPLLQVSHDTLDSLEEDNNLKPTRTSPMGGDRSVAERVFIIRESGFYQNASKQLLPAKSE
jgi:hypothetical protein